MSCETCKNHANATTPESIPYIAHETAMARNERAMKRMWIALVVSIVMLFASNAAWLIYESQFETFYYEQDSEGINSVNFGEQGDLNNGAESSL